VKPKPDKRLYDGLHRLRSNFDFQGFLKFVQEDYEHLKESLVSCDPATMPSMQGRAAALRDLIDMMTKEPPK
jgi:hypothetical protein